MDRHNGWRGLFGRLDLNGHFPTSTTDPQPMGKVGARRLCGLICEICALWSADVPATPCLLVRAHSHALSSLKPSVTNR